jgi:6-pyruvoyltetrahydropterin/6-carboxytetrahydropterin synthase
MVGSFVDGGDSMYRLRIESRFDAAHKLIGYKGKCSNLHGHTWKVEVFFIGKELDKTGILTDFGFLKKKLSEITDKLDHSFLNDTQEIGNPTAENISKYIFQSLKDLTNVVKLDKVRVWESPSSWCEYFEG